VLFLSFSTPPPHSKSSLFPYTTLFRSKAFAGVKPHVLSPLKAFCSSVLSGLLRLACAAIGIKRSLHTPNCSVNALTVSIILLAQIGRHTSELQSRFDLVCRLLLEKKKY